MKLLCWNINSLQPTIDNAKLKYGSWKGWFDEHAVDIVCLQEAKIPEDKLTKEQCCVEGFQSFWACSSGKRGYSGVTTYCSTTWAPVSCEIDQIEDSIQEEEEEEDKSESLRGQGRILVTDFGLDAFVLINVYVPNAGERPERPRIAYKLRFLRALKAKCEKLAAEGKEVLLVGDFNVCCDERDVHPRIGIENCYSEKERELFCRFLAEKNGIFVDVWREKHPEATNVYTVWDEKKNKRAFNEGVRIDFILATKKLAEKIKSCEVLSAAIPPKWSDHAGIMVEFDGEKLKPPEKHKPCKEWADLNKKFNDPSQKSILGFFSKGAGVKRKSSDKEEEKAQPETKKEKK